MQDKMTLCDALNLRSKLRKEAANYLFSGLATEAHEWARKAVQLELEIARLRLEHFDWNAKSPVHHNGNGNHRFEQVAETTV